MLCTVAAGTSLLVWWMSLVYSFFIMMATGNLSIIDQPRYFWLLQHSWRSPCCSVLPYRDDSLHMGPTFCWFLSMVLTQLLPLWCFSVVRETYLSTVKLCRGILQTPKKVTVSAGAIAVHGAQLLAAIVWGFVLSSNVQSFAALFL